MLESTVVSCLWVNSGFSYALWKDVPMDSACQTCPNLSAWKLCPRDTTRRLPRTWPLHQSSQRLAVSLQSILSSRPSFGFLFLTNRPMTLLHGQPFFSFSLTDDSLFLNLLSVIYWVWNYFLILFSLPDPMMDTLYMSFSAAAVRFLSLINIAAARTCLLEFYSFGSCIRFILFSY